MRKPATSTNGTAISVSLTALEPSTVERANVKANHAEMIRHAAVSARIHAGEISRSLSSPATVDLDAARVLTNPPTTGFANLASV